jgi:hypothetical protein
MDQFATVKDFGAMGDGITDDTAAINRALYQLYCREVNPAIRRSLFFPAGVYLVTGTINVPPYATLQGEGPKNSIIQMAAASTATYVVQTSDSLQQTGANIGTNGAEPPTSITIENMCFQSLDPMDIAFVNRASECIFNQVQFIGPLTTADLTVDSDNTACVRFDSSDALDVHQIKFDNCGFTGTTYGVRTDQHVRGVGITGAHFSTLFKGILLEVNPDGNDFSPQGFGITNCDFDTVYNQGIVFYTDRNATAQNTFGDVGNHFGGVTQPYTSIIDFLSPNNLSVGDMFERADAYAVVHPRIDLNGEASIAFTNGQQLAMGTYVRDSGLTVSLSNNVITPTNAITYNLGSVVALSINYTIVRGTAYRTGIINITTTGSGSLNYTDDFTENASTGITLTVTQSGSTVFVKYISTNTGAAASLTYSITHLA